MAAILINNAVKDVRSRETGARVGGGGRRRRGVGEGGMGGGGEGGGIMGGEGEGDGREGGERETGGRGMLRAFSRVRARGTDSG